MLHIDAGRCRAGVRAADRRRGRNAAAGGRRGDRQAVAFDLVRLKRPEVAADVARRLVIERRTSPEAHAVDRHINDRRGALIPRDVDPLRTGVGPVRAVAAGVVARNEDAGRRRLLRPDVGHASAPTEPQDDGLVDAVDGGGDRCALAGRAVRVQEPSVADGFADREVHQRRARIVADDKRLDRFRTGRQGRTGREDQRDLKVCRTDLHALTGERQVAVAARRARATRSNALDAVVDRIAAVAADRQRRGRSAAEQEWLRFRQAAHTGEVPGERDPRRRRVIRIASERQGPLVVSDSHLKVPLSRRIALHAQGDLVVVVRGGIGTHDALHPHGAVLAGRNGAEGERCAEIRR